MMKMMILAPRRSDMTHAEFRDYVLNVHGPLVKSVTEVAADIRHYHYNFPVFGAEDVVFGHPIATYLDIVTQGWFDSRAAQLRNMARPRYLEIVRPDEHKFADGSRAVMHYTHEVEITAGDATPEKIFYFRRRREGLNREEFQTRWRRGFTELVSDSPVWRQAVSRCIQNHVLSEADHPAGSDPKFFDLIDEVFLNDPSDLARIAEDGDLVERLRALEAELLDTDRTRAIVTKTIKNIG